MAANMGRDLLLKQDSTVLAGVRTKGLSINKEPVDVTTDDEDGYRTYLAEAGQVAIDISVDGITKDAELRSSALTNTTITLTDLNIEYPNGDTITGDFVMNSFEESGTYNDAITFTATIQSSGEWTYTAA